MKKRIIMALALVLVLASSVCINNKVQAAIINKTMKADVQAIRIPAGTTMKLELVEPFSSRTGNVGDEFSAMLVDDKIVNGKIALPAGSVIRGTIYGLIPSKRLSRSAIIYFNLDHVVTPTGRQIPVNAGLFNYRELTLDGGVYEGGNYGYAIKENWAKTKKIFNRTIEWGKNTGGNLQYVCVPVGAIGGVFGGVGYYIGTAIADLYNKGNDVNWQQGKQFEVMLTQPLDIPLH